MRRDVHHDDTLDHAELATRVERWRALGPRGEPSGADKGRQGGPGGVTLDEVRQDVDEVG
jgi:hypothetical protein